jgi:hypothetical protein
MKPRVICASLFSASLLLSTTAVVQAEEHDGSGEGIQNAINQIDQNIEKYQMENPDKDVPKGLLHARDVLASVQAGERPPLPDVAARPELPDVASTRPERPELPDVASARPERPELPDVASARPERPELPDAAQR